MSDDSLQPIRCANKSRTILTLCIRRRVVIFTASSALSLEDGMYEEDILCRTLHLLRKFSVSFVTNSGLIVEPPSEELEP